MKTLTTITKTKSRSNYYRSALIGIAALLFLPVLRVDAQVTNDSLQLILEGVQDLGNGKYRAHFGYKNPTSTEIAVADNSSYSLTSFSKTRSSEPTRFKSGRKAFAFSAEFSGSENVSWKVTLPDGSVREVSADVKSKRLKMIPSYTPPVNMKKSKSVLTPELSALYENYSEGNKTESGEVFQINDSKVLLEVRANKLSYSLFRKQIMSVDGFVLSTENPASSIITGWYPISSIPFLETVGNEVIQIRPVFPSITHNTGIALNNGDFSLYSHAARSSYDISGKGIKVGVLSDSYNMLGGAANDVINGDLPGKGNIDGNLQDVEVVKEYPYQSGFLSDEGRGILQIIHDIAPGADLAFRTGFLSPEDMAAGILELANDGCDIIIDDITHITEPFFTDGVVARAVDNVTSQGVTYFSAAGNFGRKSYTAQFNPSNLVPSGLTGTFHNFGANDILQNISLKAGSYVIVMQWTDAAAAQNDFDIYIGNPDGSNPIGFNRDNLGTDPVEILPFTISEDTDASIMISRVSGTSDATVKYVVFRGDMTINEYNTGSSTIVGQANSAGAITIGAVKYDNTPYYGVTVPTIASFSSTGGTPVAGVTRQKPDITAPNGVNTTLHLSNFDLDGDGNYEFYGTSAAAAHAAAVAALIKEAGVKYNQSQFTPSQIRQILESTAIDMELPGADYISGSGFIQADASIATFAAPRPSITELIVADGKPAGQNPVTVTVSGSYFTPETRILLKGRELKSTYINSAQIEAVVPAFSGNPAVTAYTPAKSIAQTDGGYSDPAYFSNRAKRIITIAAGNATKKYGEDLPEFTYSITESGSEFDASDFLSLIHI